jgi:hypothetical protein
LVDVLEKVRREGASTIEKIMKSYWWFQEEWKLNLALKTAHAEFFIILSGGCELLSIKVKYMTVLAFYIHEFY